MRQTAKPSGRALAAGLVGISLVAALSTGGTGSAGATTLAAKPSATTSAPAPTKMATTSLSVEPGRMPVYWVAKSRRSFALYREFRTVPNTGGPISSAVSAMTRMRPLDSDYMNPWRPASSVTASQTGNLITVNLSHDAFANTQIGSEVASRAVQQLVYTATAAARQSGSVANSVKITVDGAAYEAWGAVWLREPVRRAPMATVQAHTWVTSPQEGEALSAGSVIFKGFGTSFESNFVWQVRNESGAVVAKGFTTGGGGDGTFGEFTFSARLAAGRYSVEVTGDDPSGGAEGLGAAVDDKGFTVR